MIISGEQQRLHLLKVEFQGMYEQSSREVGLFILYISPIPKGYSLTSLSPCETRFYSNEGTSRPPRCTTNQYRQGHEKANTEHVRT